MAQRVDYRPDIDGLRAVAVVLVVMYHLGVGFTKGGFIGVDVFFVISGYLITRIISAETTSGHFSLLGFYERRVRRLFPALFAVLAFSSIVASFTLFPSELNYFGRTLAAAVFFVANILFYNGSGYFDGTNEVVPLLHTWSLAVEEQFYLFYPLALAPLLLQNRGHPGRLSRAIFVAVAICSFCLSLFFVAHDRSAAFFLLPSRAWELLIGALLALGAVPEIRSALLRQWAALSGLLLILAAAGAINRNTVFPGWAALAPCLGAALIIHSGTKGDTPVYRLLSSKGFVFVGLISYSLYLWHWPLIVFYKASFGFPSHAAMVLLGTVSLVLAALSWRYVETPFRKRTRLVSRRSLFSTAAVTSGAALAVAVFLVATEGLSYRYPESLRRLASFQYDPTQAMREGTCFISRAFSHSTAVDPSCVRAEKGRRNVLLVGDSHAAHYWAGLARTFTDFNFLQATASGCMPILEGGGAARCRSVIDAAFQDYIPNRHLDAVIIAASWSRKDVPGLLRTVDYLSNHVGRVYIFGPIVAYNDLLPRLLTRSELLSDPMLIRQLRVPTMRSLDKEFADALASSSARYVSIYGILCDRNDNCLTKDHDGFPIQFDKAHLTEAGSIIVARALREQRILDFHTLTSER